MSSAVSLSSLAGAREPAPRLSYKFQRVREQIRVAIQDGAFSGRLPGERTLAKRFNANAKTINKALNDLCAEGLLVRRIGSGTFLQDAASGAGLRIHAKKTVVCLLTSPAGSATDRALLEALRLRFDDDICHFEELSSTGRECVIRGSVESALPLDAWPLALRSVTSVLIACPCEPLRTVAGHLGRDCLLEAHRRQVPVIAVGAQMAETRNHAIVPDYFDAGYQTAQHLFRSGAARIRVVAAAPLTPEARTAVNGCYSAALRLGYPLSAVLVPSDPRESNERGAGHGDSIEGPADSAVLWLGGSVLRNAIRTIENGQPGKTQPRAAAILEPGDPIASDYRVSAFEFSAGPIADWAAKLAMEIRPALRPMGLTITGRLTVRERSGG